MVSNSLRYPLRKCFNCDRSWLKFCMKFVPLMRQDIASTTRAAGGLCYKHGRTCRVPEEKVALYLAGFSCKNNSVLNPTRFVRDPLHGGESATTFEGTLNSLVLAQPSFFVLENVNGARQAPACESESGVMLIHVVVMHPDSHPPHLSSGSPARSSLTPTARTPGRAPWTSTLSGWRLPCRTTR